MELREPWFVLRSRAETSRLPALLTVLFMAVLYLKVNRVAAARGVTVFDPAQLFVLRGRSLDSRIPYLGEDKRFKATLGPGPGVRAMGLPVAVRGTRAGAGEGAAWWRAGVVRRVKG